MASQSAHELNATHLDEIGDEELVDHARAVRNEIRRQRDSLTRLVLATPPEQGEARSAIQSAITCLDLA